MPKGKKTYSQRIGYSVVCPMCGTTYAYQNIEFSQKLMEIHRKKSHNKDDKVDYSKIKQIPRRIIN